MDEEPAVRQQGGMMMPLHLACLSVDASNQDAIAWVETAKHLAQLLGVQPEQVLMFVDPVLFSAWSTWHSQQLADKLNG
ncbi:hypothetical protein H4R24_005324 [Coemansia sp. RSA 988]|nr:hypothetical protein H4R24_005324 [Coemansia sp. RSA 988]